MINDPEFDDMPLLERDGLPIPIIEWDPNRTVRVCYECKYDETKTQLHEVLIYWHITEENDVYCKMNICPNCIHTIGPEAWNIPGETVSSLHLKQLEAELQDQFYC